jgi:signal transduction histidine kinase
MVVALVLSTILEALGAQGDLLDALITGPAFLALPVAIGVAVLQFHLYDLDVVVKKALVAGTLAVVVIAVYGALVGLYGLVAAEGTSSGWVFVVALALGLAFRPVSRFARRLADRVVYGRRATPYEVLTEFSERVGDAYATEDVLERMARLLGEGTGAERVDIWLHVGGGLRPAACWPGDLPEETHTLPLFAVARPGTFEVRHHGEILGAITVAMPANDPMNPAKERVIRDLASQAGLVLRNARLVEELRASQRRLVAARDEERRRIERNIHDGAQQQLVALSVQARLVRQLAGRDPEKADGMISVIEAQLQTALEDLRDLARGIYPPLLADKGLGPALEAQARRSPVPVTVETNGVGRFPQEIEAAVYFACLEALQNIAKYAEATSARVTVARVNGDLTFEVSDDGRGFDPDRTRYGTGLQGIADRLAALDGRLEVRSRPGAGTRIAGSLECSERVSP